MHEERLMDDARTEHPDEGTIHAWLDGALDDAHAEALRAHVASCRDCAERVAEARGLIAGASRIVGALDGGMTTTMTAPSAAAAITSIEQARSRSARRWLRVTPARAAIAATVLVAIGVSLTVERGAEITDLRQDVVRTATMEATDAAAAPTMPRDSLLEEAVKRNVAAAQPPRAVEAAPGPALPTPEPVAPGAVLGDMSASRRVAVGRAAVQAQRDSTAGTSPDQLAGGAGSAVLRPAASAIAAARKAESAGAFSAAAPAAAPPPRGAECYRVESANGTAASWGTVPLPLVVAVEGGLARVLTVAGQGTDERATVSAARDDSLLLRLRRVGFEGTLALGAPGDVRAGVMRSRPANLPLESVVATATSADSGSPAANRRAVPTRRDRAGADVQKAAPAPAAPSAPVAEVSSAVNAAPAVPVVARRIACPG
jgi:hypothetical protein